MEGTLRRCTFAGAVLAECSWYDHRRYRHPLDEESPNHAHDLVVPPSIAGPCSPSKPKAQGQNHY